jgi:hypothetical protein
LPDILDEIPRYRDILVISSIFVHTKECVSCLSKEESMKESWLVLMTSAQELQPLSTKEAP